MNLLLRDYEVPNYAHFDSSTLGVGKFEYKHQKISGRQRYRLYDGEGKVEFKFSSQDESITIRVDFDQIQTEADDVKASIADLLYRFSIIVAPTFRQSVQARLGKKVGLVAIKSPTRISFFPSIEVGRTLYMADVRQLLPEISNNPEKMSRYMVPVCYAVNRF
jgi:hypothetical protein